jgi:UDP-N-acetylmuramoylalanine--D-glutamate ligase
MEEMLEHNYGKDSVINCIEDIANKKVTIMGLGLNGGGEASARFFLKHGAFVTITDMKSETELASSVQSIKEDTSIDCSKIKWVLGKHEKEDFENADIVIKNPGVKYSGNQYLAVAKCIETDLSIFLRLTKSPIIAVTGSKGKSSTVSAIHYGLNRGGVSSLLGGNITVSPLTFLEKTHEQVPVILELSSWQLSDLRGRGLLKPKIAIITKIVPDHQNWYGNMDAYVSDKKLIYTDQGPDDYTICGDDEWGDVFASETKGKVIRYPTDNSIDYPEGFPENLKGDWLDKVVVPGKHMHQNILNAALVMDIMKVPTNYIKQILTIYPGIPHRLEFCHKWNIIDISYRVFNDSAATVPEATIAAINSFSNSTHLICGGTDKKLEFEALASKLEESTKGENPSVVSIWLLKGTGTDKLTPLLDEKKVSYNGPYDDLKDLLADLRNYSAAYAITTSNNTNSKEQTILFSPGATSFGMFSNEFDRGNTFKKLVQSIFVS